ncbi:HAD family hydrolase [Phototrophicus methaneseepsis]|uniref:HAD family hydrolase n=1 Tax=Phototrophicus methaneseepsis TaxID=2710758 RepID=A0A7S8E9E7_9CHLR|nr:HAD family hydrolase [Phototrophicus methaneseepsis]QPC82811.1 HAD family hydrolase [Phototrophicus methaneseepsis]
MSTPENAIETIIFFDIDATLVENRFSTRVMADILQEIADASGQPRDALGRALVAENQRRQLETPDDPLTMDWGDIALTVAQQYGVSLSQSLDALWEAYANVDEVDLLDDSPAVVASLKAPHRQLVIATKGLSKYQYPVLRVSGLLDLFDGILAPDIAGLHKASPGYHNSYTRTAPDALIVQVGDHYEDDVMAPKRNGFVSILRAPIEELAVHDAFERPQYFPAYADRLHTYPKEGTNVLPDAIVLSLQEVPALINQLEAEKGIPKNG